jgi:antitoxin (DNA-binding transcriptional repressor) of toxin-antitoxin stability system
MRFISVREFRANTGRIWRGLKKEKHLVLTSRGKPVAVVTATDETRVADTLLEIARQEAKAALKSIQEDAEKRGLSGMSMEDIDAEIAHYRRKRRATGGAGR